MNHTEVNWKDKDIEEVYEFYNQLTHSEKYPFFKWLSSQHPEIEFEWLDTFEDLRTEMSYTENISACEEFILWYPFYYPDEYAGRYEFIERDLCDYYLKNGDLEKLRQRIGFISKHPVSGIDTITIRLYFQLLYHGLYEDALNYARAVLKPIEDAENIWGNPEINFVQGLYLDSLQKAYQTYKKTNSVDFTEVFSLATKIGLEENKKIFEIEQKALTNPFNPKEILDRVNSQFDDCFVELNVYFLKYMFDTYNIPFMLSEVFWNIVAMKNLFGKSTDNNDFFYIDVKTFDKSIDKRFDYFLGSNNLEMFGKVWALYYIYEFLEENNLISAETSIQMRENNMYHRNEVIRYTSNELWQMNFVFNWPQNQLWSELKLLFESTYNKSIEEVRVILKEFSDINPPVPRIKDEIKNTKSTKNHPMIFNTDNQPYKKTTPNIGRNEPCHCGSGKKYKSCCLNN
jgi:hypothetical protein